MEPEFWASEDHSALIDDDGDIRITNGDDTLCFTPDEWRSLVEATRPTWDKPSPTIGDGINLSATGTVTMHDPAGLGWHDAKGRR